jgi:hypothetical protein
MRAINHALTGAVIGLSVSSPAIALPVAFASHYVMDALPHYDYDGDQSGRWIGTKRFAIVMAIDALLCGVVVAILAILQPTHWITAIIGAFVAALPDFFSVGRYIHIRKGQKHQPNAYERFAAKIQWFERPIGAVVEITWFLAMGYAFFALIH